MIKISIKRFDKNKEPKEFLMQYSVDSKKLSSKPTLLETLKYIKKNIDKSLTFSSGCRSGVCGSCAVRVNGLEKLSCSYIIQDGDVIEALNRVDVIRDLVVDKSKTLEVLKRVKTFLVLNETERVSNDSMKKIDKQSNCILCLSCHSICPILDIKDFISPFALTKSYRYINDIRESKVEEKVELVQTDGVWDCSLCGGCTMVCPQGIDPKMDIMMLQSKSTQLGFSNPNVANFGGFNSDFGFNPSF